MKLKQNNVYCGDSLELMKLLPDKSVDLVLTDPPYGIGLKYASYDDSDKNWIDLMSRAIPEMRRVGKMVILPSCRILRLPWIYANFPPDWLISWYKGSPGHAAYIGFNDWEPLLVYGRTKNRLYMHDHFQTIASPKKGTYDHPCPKPLEWAEWLVQRASDEDMLVLDPFCGSGTVGVACKKLKRRFILIDKEPKYCAIARERLKTSK